MADTITTALNGEGPKIYNATRALLGSNDKSLLPVGTDNNIGDIKNAFMNYPQILNNYMSALLNKVGLTLTTASSFKNPTAFLKRRTELLGNMTEEVWVDLLEEKVFNPDKDAMSFVNPEKPNFEVAYYVRNRESHYDLPISEEQQLAAFNSWTANESMLAKIFSRMEYSNERDEFKYGVLTAISPYLNNDCHIVEIGDLNTKDELENFVIKARETSKNMSFLNTWSPRGVLNNTDVDDQILFITSELEAKMDVKVLAAAFNMDETKFLARKVTVPSFASVAGLGDVASEVVAVLADTRGIRIEEQLNTVRSFQNPSTLSTNYIYHVWQTYSYSQFHPVVTFVSKVPDDKKHKLIVTPPVSIIGNTGKTKTITATIDSVSPLASGTEWLFSATSDYSEVSVDVDSTTGIITATVSDNARPTHNAIIKVTAKVVDSKTKAAVTPAIELTADAQLQVSQYVNLNK